MTDTAVEQRGAEAVCKTTPTGSIPAIASTNYDEFIEIMKRDDCNEMLAYLGRIYQENYASLNGNPAHDMVRLASSIVIKYDGLKNKSIELSKENSKLRRSKTLEGK